MPPAPRIATERLVLRPWTTGDVEAFAAMNADPVVMEHFPSTLTRGETEAFVERIVADFECNGFGLWAVEVPGVAPFIGYVGLDVPRFEASFTPAVEIGWRLAAAHWGRGYATEAGRAVVRFAFDEIGLAELVSFTSVPNARSQAVMQRLGMTLDGTFEHPKLPEGHPLRTHVLYRLRRPAP